MGIFEGIKWIGLAPGETELAMAGSSEEERAAAARRRSVFLRREFSLARVPVSARLSICGLGLYEVRLNAVAPDPLRVYAPLWTQFSKKVLYDVYDVTRLLRQGANVLLVELGGGRYCTNPAYWGWRMKWYGNPRLILRLDIGCCDGSSESIVSDGSFLVSDGAAVTNCIYDGEERDLRLEPREMYLPGYECRGWRTAVEVEPPAPRLEECEAPPVRACRTLRPVEARRLSPTRVLLDFGENTAARVALTVRGRRGSTVSVEHAENINADGTLDTTTNRGVGARDTFILAGGGAERLEARFTYHGFRWAMVTFSDEDTLLLCAESRVLHSDVEKIGDFECSDARLNRLHDVIIRSQLSNLIGIPLDCPQRDERLGWLGDAHVTAETCLYNFDMRGFYRKFLDDCRTEQDEATGACAHIVPFVTVDCTPDWSSGYPIIVWYNYKFYGDKSLLAEHYVPMKRYVDCLVSMSDDWLLPRSRYGDWLSPLEGWVRGDPEYTNSVFLCLTLGIVSRTADILAVEGDREELHTALEASRRALAGRYYRDGVFGDGSQFSQSAALLTGIVPAEERERALDVLCADIDAHGKHLTTGILGTKYVMEALCRFGRCEAAAELMEQSTYPSWLALIDGRTTLPEKWNGGGSGNHCMFGSADVMFYRMTAGIRLDRAADKPLVFSPFFREGMSWARASVRLPEGAVSSAWTRDGDTAECLVSAPFDYTFVPPRGWSASRTGGLRGDSYIVCTRDVRR